MLTCLLIPTLCVMTVCLIFFCYDTTSSLAASSDSILPADSDAQAPPLTPNVLQVQNSQPAFDIFSLAFQPPNRDGVRTLPRVDRAHLAKLDSLALLLDPSDETNPLHPSAILEAKTRWPPVVTSLPAPPTPQRPSDQALCGSPRCRFLLPLRISEPEARARNHVAQLARLAQSLNRTLVLPNAGKGRLGACFHWPLARYYDVGGLGAHTAPLDAFQSWTRGRGSIPPTAQIAWLSARADAALDYSETITRPELVAGVLASEIDEVVSRLPGCLDTKFALSLDAHAPVFVRPERRALKGGQAGEAIAEALEALAGEHNRAADAPVPLEPADVLVVNWDLRAPLFSDVRKLAHAPDLAAAAGAMAPVKPFVAVDWRMESLDEETILVCARSLVATLGKVLLAHDDIHDVWLGIDVPLSVAKVEELDLPSVLALQERGVRQHHADGAKVVSRAFRSGGELEGWKVRGYEEFDNAGLSMETLQDVGVRDIVNRLMGGEASLLIASGESCGKPGYVSNIWYRRVNLTDHIVSVSTQNLIDERKSAFAGEAGPTMFRNDVVYFEQ
ncbi:uncharacterized protein SCHCODRAFT_02642621 [Schizophyllum commune H4-8]|nr:uncharacterized protein SCHCODRAFT_02642621 [Schizophyllum commune H4-8]KAI5885850.1 hypothetical protein SCHCODRAFT_02642621 [Schizophyllum commune H4-8]